MCCMMEYQEYCDVWEGRTENGNHLHVILMFKYFYTHVRVPVCRYSTTMVVLCDPRDMWHRGPKVGM